MFSIPSSQYPALFVQHFLVGILLHSVTVYLDITFGVTIHYLDCVSVSDKTNYKRYLWDQWSSPILIH